VSASAFDKALDQLRRGVSDVFAAKRTLPGFILLYTSIDILASLTRPENSERTDSGFFKDWVRSYMLTPLAVPCSADDLWGARCGLLHTLTAESDMSRSKGAKMLNYIGDDATAKAMQQKHDPTCSHDIFISTHHFVDAFLAACDRFAAEVRSNASLQKRAYSHAAKLMVAFD
jgi:hypothetical protein